MSLFGKKHETELVVYSYEVEDTSVSTTTDTSISSGRHCAWCGDPPDQHGSHGICEFHAAQMAEQAAARRRSRGRA